MKGDFTRFTFRRADHFSGVRLQQGRVQVDADWNEQVDIQLDRERTEVRDVVGPLGAPVAEPGFGLVPLPAVGGGPADFAIGAGRMYVQGILVELDAGRRATPASVTQGSFVLPAPYLDGRLIVAGEWLEFRSGAGGVVHRAMVGSLADAAGGKMVAFTPTKADLASTPGLTVARIVTFRTQPEVVPGAHPAPGNGYVAYLDVWERHLTALEEPRLREVALGGPDTATRTQVVWQVRMEPLPGSGTALCADFGPGWTPGGQSTGRLRARGQLPAGAATPCIVPEGAGYRRLENQLYRVEIHAHGIGPFARYKWSRDNGHVVSRVKTVDAAASRIEVEPQGRDDVLDFAPGQVVEVTEPRAALRGEAGVLASVTHEADGVLTLAAPPGGAAPNVAAFAPGFVVRRWEGTAAVQPDTWTDLEDGVQVWFEAGGDFRVGDHWTIPARTAAGTVEWPREGNQPVALPAQGVRHAYCPLAIVTQAAGGSWTATDCRRLFPPLSAMTRMVYLGGDGQEAMPTTPELKYPLQVGVLNGGVPVEGAVVRFTVVEGAGQLNGGPGPVFVPTSGGVASVAWRLGTTANDQRVRADLFQYGALAQHPPIHFLANLSEAKEVHFAAPQGCANLAGTTTVQEAIERLSRTTNLFYAGGDGQHAVPGQALEQPLAVRVVSDCGPVQGVVVTFAAAGGGRLATALPIADGQGTGTLTVTTGPDGLAQCYWRLAEGANAPVAQRVSANLPTTLPAPWRRGGSGTVTFGAKHLRADMVQYTPATACTALAGTDDVQGALDALCARIGGPRPGIAVERVAVASLPSLVQLSDAEIGIGDLAKGLLVQCASDLDPAAFIGPHGFKPVCYVTVQVPEIRLIYDEETQDEVRVRVGTRPVVLDCRASADGRRITWRPVGAAIQYLLSLFNEEAESDERMLAHLTLKGRFIWGSKVKRHLGGMLLGGPGPAAPGTTRRPTHLDFKAGAGEEGSDLELWFWLRSPHREPQSGAIPTDGTFKALARSVAASPAARRTASGAASAGATVAAVEVPPAVRAGQTAEGRVLLSAPAPHGGLRVHLSSSDAQVNPDAEVVVPAGKTEAPFSIQVGKVSAGTRFTVSASTEGGVLRKRVRVEEDE